MREDSTRFLAPATTPAGPNRTAPPRCRDEPWPRLSGTLRIEGARRDERLGNGVEVIRRTERRQPAQRTPGMLREEAFTGEGTWIGTVRTEPGVETGWHHHGDYESY